jgi:MOSC domain-containing protein YiiM
MEETVEKFPEPELTLDRNGVIGDRFYGPTRYSNSRHTVIPNDRMWSAVTIEDVMFTLAHWNKLLRDKQLPARLTELDPAWFGPNICFSGMIAFSLVPPGTQFVFSGGPILIVAEENQPCMTAAQFIADRYADQNVKPEFFVKAALLHRGLVGYVEKGGIIRVGDSATVVYPSSSSNVY